MTHLPSFDSTFLIHFKTPFNCTCWISYIIYSGEIFINFELTIYKDLHYLNTPQTLLHSKLDNWLICKSLGFKYFVTCPWNIYLWLKFFFLRAHSNILCNFPIFVNCIIVEPIFVCLIKEICFLIWFKPISFPQISFFGLLSYWEKTNNSWTTYSIVNLSFSIWLKSRNFNLKFTCGDC